MHAKTCDRLTMSQERQAMTLPQRNIRIGLFFNERLQMPEQHHVKNHTYHPSYRNPMVASMRPIASLRPAKNGCDTQFACSHFLKSEKSTFGKVLKFHNPLFTNKPRKVSLPTDKSLDLKSSMGLTQSQLHQSGHLSANNSFLAHESAIL